MTCLISGALQATRQHDESDTCIGEGAVGERFGEKSLKKNHSGFFTRHDYEGWNRSAFSCTARATGKNRTESHLKPGIIRVQGLKSERNTRPSTFQIAFVKAFTRLPTTDTEKWLSHRARMIQRFLMKHLPVFFIRFFLHNGKMCHSMAIQANVSVSEKMP